jgi:hypothetical protein
MDNGALLFTDTRSFINCGVFEAIELEVIVASPAKRELPASAALPSAGNQSINKQHGCSPLFSSCSCSEILNLDVFWAYRAMESSNAVVVFLVESQQAPKV